MKIIITIEIVGRDDQEQDISWDTKICEGVGFREREFSRSREESEIALNKILRCSNLPAVLSSEFIPALEEE